MVVKNNNVRYLLFLVGGGGGIGAAEAKAKKLLLLATGRRAGKFRFGGVRGGGDQDHDHGHGGGGGGSGLESPGAAQEEDTLKDVGGGSDPRDENGRAGGVRGGEGVGRGRGPGIGVEMSTIQRHGRLEPA